MPDQEIVVEEVAGAKEAQKVETYSFDFTRAEVELIVAGLAELPAKHSMYFIQGIQSRCAQIDAERTKAE